MSRSFSLMLALALTVTPVPASAPRRALVQGSVAPHAQWFGVAGEVLR